MRVLFLTVLVGVLGAGSLALAASNETNNPATLCLDGLGYNHPPSCYKQQASRFKSAPDICICKGPYRQVKAPWCKPGETPPADTAEFERARAAYADKHHNDLTGASYQGKPMCVPLGGGGE